MPRSRNLGGRFASHRSGGSQRWPSASMTSVVSDSGMTRAFCSDASPSSGLVEGAQPAGDDGIREHVGAVDELVDAADERERAKLLVGNRGSARNREPLGVNDAEGPV